MTRLLLYSVSSTLLTCGTLAYAYYSREQFYPAVIFLSTSKLSIVLMGNFILSLVLILGRMTKTIFLGRLRDAEMEILYENSRYAITETCLALTIFRGEFGYNVLILFTILLFSKIFHWLSQSRLEFIEQSENVSRMTHIRISCLISLLLAIDIGMVAYLGVKILETGPSVRILFAFEFLIMCFMVNMLFFRFFFHLVDLFMEGTWNSKTTFMFYLELLYDVTKLVAYLVFFLVIFSYYGIPLHIVRDLWVSITNLQRRVLAYFRYRKITRNMNERFPNPTVEELESTDHICIICREEMTTDTSKKLVCSHIFHLNCLRMWLQRQQTCPTCRSNITSTDTSPTRRDAARTDQPVSAASASTSTPSTTTGTTTNSNSTDNRSSSFSFGSSNNESSSSSRVTLSTSGGTSFNIQLPSEIADEMETLNGVTISRNQSTTRLNRRDSSDIHSNHPLHFPPPPGSSICYPIIPDPDQTLSYVRNLIIDIQNSRNNNFNLSTREQNYAYISHEEYRNRRK